MSKSGCVSGSVAGEGGGRLRLNHACMCVSKVKEMGSFWLQENEMNEKMSFKMGVKFAASYDKGKNFLDVWNVFV